MEFIFYGGIIVIILIIGFLADAIINGETGKKIATASVKTDSGNISLIILVCLVSLPVVYRLIVGSGKK
ncbi:MAG: hypothetical protein M3P33_00605 [bacterium]|nr:hypothetical protein [bacterium]